MDFSWTREQRDLHDRMRALGESATSLADLGAGGALGLCIAAEHGGAGHDLVTTAFAYEGLGATSSDAGVLLAAGAHLFGVAATLQRVGNAAQKKKWLSQLAAGACIATVAATEKEAGSDVAAGKASVEVTDGAVRARGDKNYVTSADVAGLFLFFGRRTAALVPRSEGVSVGALYETAGLRGARLAPVSFDVQLAEDAVLGRPGAGMSLFQIAMTFERGLILAFRLGAMQRALDSAIAFARKRRIHEHQAVAHRIARMKMRLETSRLLVYRAAWSLDHGERGHAEAALAKWHAAESAVQSALDALTVRGGAGYIDDQPAEVMDAIGGSIHSGTNDILANITAGWLGL